MKQAVGQHKRLAMGEKVGFASGGTVARAQVGNIGGGALKSGTPMGPLEKAKRANGVPGMKKGGRAC